jgi:hypothetical protein
MTRGRCRECHAALVLAFLTLAAPATGRAQGRPVIEEQPPEE